jgi:hypothetical protein
MAKSWRDYARSVIRDVIKDNEGKSESEIKRALREAYPFGARKYHPYKIWLDEIKVQTGKRKFGQRKVTTPDNQSNLFT